ncbi:hypothetical protein D2Q93_11085 [Alicyclobacillaceae bacterium I2511]|nr:hypothetical protein D2Q93_11085 [Alicyclobacillaceae bacterium I2511]
MGDIFFRENVWWPTLHNFSGLHPKYETPDFMEKYRYIDFTYIQPHLKIAIDGWHVLRFTYQDIKASPLPRLGFHQ